MQISKLPIKRTHYKYKINPKNNKEKTRHQSNKKNTENTKKRIKGVKF